MKGAIGWLVLLLFVIADKVLCRRFPRVWEALQLPLNLFLSVLSTLSVIIALMGMGQILSGSVSGGDKAFACVLLSALIAAFIFANVSCWRAWYRRRKGSPS